MPTVPIEIDITSPITGGDNTTLRVTLDQTATADISVSLSASPSGILTAQGGGAFPSSVTVPTGSDHVDVTIGSVSVSSDTSVTVTASANNSTASGGVLVKKNTLLDP